MPGVSRSRLPYFCGLYVQQRALAQQQVRLLLQLVAQVALQIGFAHRLVEAEHEDAADTWRALFFHRRGNWLPTSRKCWLNFSGFDDPRRHLHRAAFDADLPLLLLEFEILRELRAQTDALLGLADPAETEGLLEVGVEDGVKGGGHDGMIQLASVDFLVTAAADDGERARPFVQPIHQEEQAPGADVVHRFSPCE